MRKNGPGVQGVAVQGQIRSEGQVELCLTVFGMQIFGSPNQTRYTYVLKLNCGEILHNEMGMNDAKLENQDVNIFFVALPQKEVPHAKFKNLKVNNYGEWSFKFGNVMFTLSVDELSGVVEEHWHNEKDVVCEWQLRFDSIMTGTTVCKHGEHHGHPNGWEDCMLAVKLKAQIIND